MNRLTISLDDDLYAMARAHAVANRLSLSKAIGELLRQRQGMVAATPGAGAGGGADSYFDAELGIRVSRSRQPLSEAEIQRAMDDEDRRHREQFGGPADRAASRPKP